VIAKICGSKKLVETKTSVKKLSEFLWKRNAVSVVAHSLVNIIYYVIVWSSLMVSSEKSSACMGSRPPLPILTVMDQPL